MLIALVWHKQKSDGSMHSTGPNVECYSAAFSKEK